MTRIEFESELFLPKLPESSQNNPGAYGFELAWWLAQRLQEAGIETSYPLGEDWGWLIEHIDEHDAEFTIGCGSTAEHGEGYLGKPVTWSVFVRPHRVSGGLLGLFRGKADSGPVATAEKLQAAIEKALSTAGVGFRVLPE
ncbi:MAG: hypothetical protein O9327_05920 [Polaromonas sp.]|nr:hypothetical protein [Polaromonas sp.]